MIGMRPLKRFRSIGFKLSLLTSVFVLSVIGIMAQRIFRTIEASMISEMSLRAQFFARSCQQALFPKLDPFQLHFHLQELLHEKGVVYAMVLDPNGKILSHSLADRVGDAERSPLALRALASGEPLVQQYENAQTHEQTYDISQPITMEGRRLGTARLGFDNSSLEKALREPRQQIAVIALAAIFAGILGTLFIVNWIIRPLPRLAAAARELEKGNFDVTVELRTNDEIGSLARAFNDMAVANALLFRSLREEKEKLATIFNETREGMVWSDANGRVLLMNTAAKQLLGFSDKEPDTLDTAFAAFKSASSISDILKTQRRLVQCDFTREKPKLLILSSVVDRLGEAGGPSSFLFVFHDATLEKREERLGRSFLSLVSHKLRTPLTVVMNYVDLLKSEYKSWDPFQQKALDSIASESDELTTLVEKLLIFTTAQSREVLQLQRASHPVSRFVENALKGLHRTLDGKVKVSWSKEELAALAPVDGDGRLLDEAVKNLIENAVKFNTNESKEVRIDAKREGNFIRLSVKDNGPGIPPEEQPKLFRPFYQIDEYFTGQIMGMGLGLAFVKNVVEAHGGQTGLKSEVGKGAEFFMTLPIATAEFGGQLLVSGS